MYQYSSGSQQNSQVQPVQQISHQPQPLKVVKRDEVEAAWRVKCSQLEKQVHELQSELQRYRGTNQTYDKVTYIEDTGRVNSLVYENDRLNRVIIDLNNEIQVWAQKYNSLEQALGTKTGLDIELDKLKHVWHDNENIFQVEIRRLREQLQFELVRNHRLQGEVYLLKENETKIQQYESLLLTIQNDLKANATRQRQKDEEIQRMQQRIQRSEMQEQQIRQTQDELKRVRINLDDKTKELEYLRRQLEARSSTNMRPF